MELLQNIGEGNSISIGSLGSSRGSEILITGRGNKVVIEDGAVLTDFKIQIRSDGNEVIIGSNCHLCGTIVQKLTEGNIVHIGKDTSIGRANIVCGESSSVIIGQDCMLSWGIDIRTTDSHGIYDIQSGERLNKAGNVVIGNHVWIGAKATFTKGSGVASGSVVGIGSLVNKLFDDENVVVAGAPANIVRRGVRWDRELLG